MSSSPCFLHPESVWYVVSALCLCKDQLPTGAQHLHLRTGDFIIDPAGDYGN